MLNKLDIGLIIVTALVIIAIVVLQWLGQSLSVLPEALIALVGVIVGKKTGPVVEAIKARSKKE